MRAVVAVIDKLNVAIRFCVGTLVALMLLDVSLGIFYRYVVGSALVWTEELARYLMVWAGFLAASIALREGLHVSFDVLVQRLSGRWARVAKASGTLGVLLFLVITAIEGYRLMRSVASQRSPVLEISMAWAYGAIPASAVLMLIELLAIAVRKADRPIPQAGAVEQGVC